MSVNGRLRELATELRERGVLADDPEEVRLAVPGPLAAPPPLAAPGHAGSADPLRPYRDAIRSRRAELGLSQRYLAARAGIGQPAVSRLESGDLHAVLPATWKAIGRVLWPRGGTPAGWPGNWEEA